MTAATTGATAFHPSLAATKQPGEIFNAADFVLAELDPQQIWDRVITIAVRERASDVHLASQRGFTRVALRLDGRLCPQGLLPAEVGARVSNHVKVTAKLDLAERRRPQDGRISVDVDGRPVDLRVAILPTTHGESVAVRIQDREVGLLNLDQLGMEARQLAAVRSLVDTPSGLVLVTGPTGSGKSTTLYALLRHLADGSRKVVTVETPVEYDLDGVDQAEVNYRIGVDYAALVRAALRQDPNVIMIGEVRDAETADAVVRAANSGRLVLATTHAVHSAAAVESLIALGAHPHFVARAFRGAVAQALVRRVCTYCAVPLSETSDAEILADVRDLLEPEERVSLSLGRGCPQCRGTGYRGRAGVFEVLLANDEIRTMLSRGAPSREVYRAAVRHRMMTIAEAGKLAALRGVTTLEELLQNVSEVWTGSL